MNIFKGKKIFAVLIALTLVLSSVPINSVNAKTNINNSEISVQLVNSTSIKVVAGKQIKMELSLKLIALLPMAKKQGM